MPASDHVRRHFEGEAGAYSARSASGFWGWWRGRELAAVMALLVPRRGERILDAGSGAGFYTAALARTGCEVAALDLSEAMLGHARNAGAAATICGDLAGVALPPDFDAVLCAGALEFVADPAAAVRNLATALADRAPRRLVVMAPADDAAGRLYRRFHRRHGLEVNLFSRQELNRLASGASLRIDMVRRIGFNFVARMVPG